MKFFNEKIILIFFVFMLGGNFFVSSLPSIEVKIPVNSKEVGVGERFYFEISIEDPENSRRKEISLVYEIKDVGGQLMSRSKVLKSIESRISYIDFIALSESIKTGPYLLEIYLEETNDQVKDSEDFQIIGAKKSDLKLYLFITIGIVFLISIFVLIGILKQHK